MHTSCLVSYKNNTNTKYFMCTINISSGDFIPIHNYSIDQNNVWSVFCYSIGDHTRCIIIDVQLFCVSCSDIASIEKSKGYTKSYN